jgi:hypothetical protein
VSTLKSSVGRRSRGLGFLATLLCLSAPAAAAEPEPRLLTTELGLGLDVLSLSNPQVRQVWQGRQLHGRAVLKGFVVEARTRFASVYGDPTSAYRGDAELRLGYSHPRFAVTAGAYLLDGFTTTPRLQWFPVAHAAIDFGGFRAIAGLYDFHLPAVPFHLGLETPDAAVSWTFPIGVAMKARLRLAPFIAAEFQALVVQPAPGEVVAFASVMVRVGILSGRTFNRPERIPKVLNPAW